MLCCWLFLSSPSHNLSLSRSLSLAAVFLGRYCGRRQTQRHGDAANGRQLTCHDLVVAFRARGGEASQGVLGAEATIAASGDGGCSLDAAIRRGSGLFVFRSWFLSSDTVACEGAEVRRWRRQVTSHSRVLGSGGSIWEIGCQHQGVWVLENGQFSFAGGTRCGLCKGRHPVCGGRRFLGCQSDTGGGEFAAVEMGLKPLLGVEQFRAVFQLCSSCASGTSSALAGDRLCIAGGMHRRHLMTQYPALVSGRDGSCTVAAAHFQWRVPSSGGNTLDKGCRYRALGGARGRAVQVAGCSGDVPQVCQGETAVG